MGRRKATDGPADAAARREAILDSAATLFANKGTAATTVREIGDAAGILSGSLYYYFASKEDIIDEVLSQSLNDLLEWSRDARATADGPAEQLSGLVRAAFRVVQEHPNACAVYLNDRNYLLSIPRFQYLEGVRVDYATLWFDVIRDGIKQGQFRSDVDPMVFFRLATYPIWLTTGAPERGEPSFDTLADQHLTLLLDGFAAPKRARSTKRQPK